MSFWLIVLFVAAAVSICVAVILRRPFSGLLLFFVADYLYPYGVTSIALRFGTLTFILGLTLVSVALRNAVAGRRQASRDPRLPRRLVVVVGLFIGVILVSSFPLFGRPGFFSPTDEAISYVARAVYFALANGLLLSTLIVVLVRTPDHLDRMFRTMLLLAIFLAVYGLTQYITGIKFLASLRVEYPEEMRWRLSSLTSPTHTVGYYFVIPTMYAAYAYLMARDQMQRTRLLSFLSLPFLAMILTTSRSLWLGLFVSAILLAILGRRHQYRRAIYLLLGVPFGLVMIYVLGFRFTSDEAVMLESPYFNWLVVPAGGWSPVDIDNIFGRAGPWSLMFIGLEGHTAFGNGVGTSTRVLAYWTKRIPRGGRPGRSVHNMFLDWMSDTGVVGLIILFLMLGLTVWNFYSVWKRAKRTGHRYAEISAAALLAIFPVFIFLDAFNSDPGFTWFFLLFGLSLVHRRFVRQPMLSDRPVFNLARQKPELRCQGLRRRPT